MVETNCIKSVFYAAWSLNPDDVLNSSSGGLWYLLGKHFIENGNYICGAVFDESFSSLRHVLSNNMSDLEKTRGSKYALSELGTDLFRDLVKKMQASKILFSGCPCQINALEFYLKNKKINTENLYTCSLVCHGSPSFGFLRNYLDILEKNVNSKMVSLFFRRKHKQSPYGKIVIGFKNGKEIHEEMLTNEYMLSFLSDKYLRDCCYNCKFKDINNLKGDVMLGDFWGVWKEYPQFYNPNGTSLLIVNKPKGEELISLIRNMIFIQQVDRDRSIKYNPMVYQSAKRK